MTSSQSSPALARTLGLRDLVLFNMVAVLSIRWLATSAAAGPSSLVLWVLAALFFFVPQGLAVSELSARFPDGGGVYAWTKRGFGQGHGFLCGWCYWVNQVLYYPTLLLSGAAIATYAFGQGDTGLGDNWWYVLPVTLGAMWLAVGANIIGLQTGKWLQNVGAIGAWIPGLVIIALGGYAVFTRPPANAFTLQTITPNLSDFSELNLWASIAFAFAGLELAASLGDEIVEPRRTLPRSIFIAAPLIAAVYLLGTGAILWLVPQKDVNIVSGVLQGISAGVRGLGAVAWIVPVAAAANAIGNIGCIGAWITGSARVAFAVGIDRYAPPAFGQVHPRWGTPWVAILVQAVLATIFLGIAVLGKGTTVAKAYLILLDTSLLVYFVPFVYLFLTYLHFGLRLPDARPGAPGRARTLLVGLSGLGVTVFAMVVASIPPSGTTDPWLFELKVVGGGAAFLLLGGALYWRGRRSADGAAVATS